MNRPRRSDRKHWPDNLNARKKAKGLYYCWKHPHTGKEFGLGYSFNDAASQAREANLSLSIKPEAAPRLIDRIAGKDDQTMSAWLDIFAGILDKRPSKKKGGTARAESTKRVDARMIEVIRESLGDLLVHKISTKDCAAMLQKYRDKGHDRAAVGVRSYLVDCFNEAEANGWIPPGSNPAKIIKTNAPRTKRNRLSLEHFKILLEHSSGWLRVSMLLALVTGQRVSDISVMSYSQVKDGFLFVQQIKYGDRVKIPLELSLLGYSIRSIIKESRRVVGAKTIVHQTESTSRSSPGDALHEGTISRAFSALVKKHLPKFKEGTPPTFHEIRALSKSLHKEGGIDTLALLGHEDAATAKIYEDPRSGWVEVKIPRSA